MSRRLLLFLALAGSAACQGDPESPLHGARLGMSLRDVRERLDVPRDPATSIRIENNPEPTLVVSARAGGLRDGSFEFHNGMLVAALVFLDPNDPGAKGPALVVTPAAVTAREPRGDQVRVRVIARDCPAHQDELRELLKSSH